MALGLASEASGESGPIRAAARSALARRRAVDPEFFVPFLTSRSPYIQQSALMALREASTPATAAAVARWFKRRALRTQGSRGTYEFPVVVQVVLDGAGAVAADDFVESIWERLTPREQAEWSEFIGAPGGRVGKARVALLAWIGRSAVESEWNAETDEALRYALRRARHV